MDGGEIGEESKDADRNLRYREENKGSWDGTNELPRFKRVLVPGRRSAD